MQIINPHCVFGRSSQKIFGIGEHHRSNGKYQKNAYTGIRMAKKTIPVNPNQTVLHRQNDKKA